MYLIALLIVCNAISAYLKSKCLKESKFVMYVRSKYCDVSIWLRMKWENYNVLSHNNIMFVYFKVIMITITCETHWQISQKLSLLIKFYLRNRSLWRKLDFHLSVWSGLFIFSYFELKKQNKNLFVCTHI